MIIKVGATNEMTKKAGSLDGMRTGGKGRRPFLKDRITYPIVLEKEQLEFLQAVAEEKGMSVSAYIRELIESKRSESENKGIGRG